MKKGAFSAIFISLLLLFAGAVFAQSEAPCVMQAPEGDENDGMLYVICNICGDGVTDDAEECDDGNTYNGDGCSSTCQGEMPLLETWPEWEGSASAWPNQKLPAELLGVGPTDSQQAIIAQNPQAVEVVSFPEEIQPTGAARIASLIAARNIKQSQLALAGSFGSTSIVLPQQLAATGGTENILSLIIVLLGVLGVRGSLRYIK